MSGFQRNVLGCALTFVVCCGSISAHASPEIRKAAILSTMAEAMISAASLTRQQYGSGFSDFSWHATYSDRDWSVIGSAEFEKRTVTFRMTGYAWGEDGQDLLLTYAGDGGRDLVPDGSKKESIHISGRSDWFFDSTKSDYLAMDFRHVMKFGDHSTWGWVLGSEILVGGVVGVGGAIVTAGAAIATGGAAVAVGVAGALAMVPGLVSMSDTVMTRYESGKQATPSDLPPRPTLPPKLGPLEPAKNKLYVLVSKDGRLQGSGPEGACLTGTFSEKSGDVEGRITRCPPL